MKNVCCHVETNNGIIEIFEFLMQDLRVNVGQIRVKD